MMPMLILIYGSLSIIGSLLMWLEWSLIIWGVACFYLETIVEHLLLNYWLRVDGEDAHLDACLKNYDMNFRLYYILCIWHLLCQLLFGLGGLNFCGCWDSHWYYNLIQFYLYLYFCFSIYLLLL
ncbi:hypothetical protein KFK09_026361 [Dendrobium nobile]|uniref:Uncharacterized protein n=1 Tax=Dendrobium nobile TaxID=94219 RepID=A0A8T3A6C5_DENNO|nr:hypothetical protein KFK09_026361 [Dendrobium nobile]